MAATKKAAAKAAPAAEAAAPVVDVAAEGAEAAAPVAAVPDVADSARFDSFIEKLQVVASAAKDLIAQVRQLQKDFVKLQKDKAKAEQVSVKMMTKKEKKAAKAADPTAKRSPSGFAKPTKLSEELCSFLNVPAGTEMARTDVTRMLNNYIKQHGLQDPEDKRSIKPNDDLQKILEPGDVTYFNLQAKIKRHFIKASP